MVAFENHILAQAHINRESIQTGSQPYMRVAEHCGMRGFLPFASYTGPQGHVGPLESEVAVHLERWLPKTEEAKEETSGTEQ